MRLLLPLLLLPGLAAADELVDVARAHYVGIGKSIAPYAVGDAYMPAILTQRSDRGHWRSVLLDFSQVDEAALKGSAAAGMARHAGAVVLATRRGGTLTFFSLGYPSGRRGCKNTPYGSLDVRGLKGARVLRMASTPNGPLVVVGHRGGLLVATPRPRGGTSDLIARPGRNYVATTEPFHADRNARLDLFAAGNASRILHVEQDGRSFRARGEVMWSGAAFTPRALAGDARQILVGGERAGGRAHLATLPTPAVLARRPGIVRALSQIDLGKGSVAYVEILDAGHAAVAGTLDGRSWVAVVSCGKRPRVVHQAFLPGTGVTAFCTNPSRVGWSFAAATNEKSFHLLRAPGDKPMPRDWNPFLRPGPEPEPAEDAPVEATPPADEKPVDDPSLDATPAGGARRGSIAILPRVEADSARGLDTEILLIYLGDRRATLTLRYVTDRGQVVQQSRLLLRRGRRIRLSVADELARRRVLDFDGYVRLDGCDRRDLIVEAAVRRGRGAPAIVRAQWR